MSSAGSAAVTSTTHNEMHDLSLSHLHYHRDVRHVDMLMHHTACVATIDAVIEVIDHIWLPIDLSSIPYSASPTTTATLSTPNVQHPIAHYTIADACLHHTPIRRTVICDEETKENRIESSISSAIFQSSVTSEVIHVHESRMLMAFVQLSWHSLMLSNDDDPFTQL
jgi:hypothetical protein